MRKYKILPVIIKEKAQVEEKVIKENIFDISNTKKQLLLNQIKYIKLKILTLLDSSHSFPKFQYSNRNLTNNFLNEK